jgi:hypothetical protein
MAVPFRDHVRTGGYSMPSLRTKSISTKVTEEEYVRLEALADGHTMSEWVREVLLKAAAAPGHAEQVIVAELVAMRSILLNLLVGAANTEPTGTEEMQRLIERADADKFERAVAKL